MAQFLPSWKVILEIVILWYVIYMVLLFVKGTRSEQLLKGLFIIAMIFIVTQQLGLNAINWTLTRLFPISILALVIVFQPELRRALAQLGQFGIHQENIEVINEVSGAVSELAKRKVGALIVIERESGLKSYIESGTVIDAKATNDLIVSIFLPQSPLHDGAVIIQHGKIAASGCVLPLSGEDKTLLRKFGMRHRAAIGLSEDTDAVCVVVSEETGTISLAHGGRLSHNLDIENLVKSLKSLLHKEARPRPQFSARMRFPRKAAQ